MADTVQYKTVEYLESRKTDESAKSAALGDAHRIAKFLSDECDAVVYGIGSLFEPDRCFGPASDIDLVVKGIPANHFFSITARAATLTRFNVDIIPAEDATKPIQQRVAEYGVRL